MTLLGAIIRFLRGRSGLEPPPLRCRACGDTAMRCMCLGGAVLEEPIGDESDVPTVRENVRAKVVVPSSAPPPKEPRR